MSLGVTSTLMAQSTVINRRACYFFFAMEVLCFSVSIDILDRESASRLLSRGDTRHSKELLLLLLAAAAAAASVSRVAGSDATR